MKKRESVRREERILPTPETLAKLELDWAVTDLTPEQQAALDKVRAAHSILTADCRVRLLDLNRTDRSISHENPGEEALLWSYSQWWSRMGGRNMQFVRIHGLIMDPLSSRARVAPVLGLIASALDEYLRINVKDMLTSTESSDIDTHRA